ncbi:MAG: thioredoxin fold domain-containing protein [Bacteroidota bacterium]
MMNWLLLSFIFLGLFPPLAAQEINWLSFEQLEDSLQKQPKKVFIDFYTDWCSYCRKMDKQVFTKTEVIQRLNQDYYAVRLNAETERPISFDGQVFYNKKTSKKRKGIHELARLLGQRNGQFAPPTMLILDESFRVQARYFEYLDSKKLLKALK